MASRSLRTPAVPLPELERRADAAIQEILRIFLLKNQLPSDPSDLEELSVKFRLTFNNFNEVTKSLARKLDEIGSPDERNKIRAFRTRIFSQAREFRYLLNKRLEEEELSPLSDLDTNSIGTFVEDLTAYVSMQSTPSEHSDGDIDNLQERLGNVRLDKVPLTEATQAECIISTEPYVTRDRSRTPMPGEPSSSEAERIMSMEQLGSGVWSEPPRKGEPYSSEAERIITMESSVIRDRSQPPGLGEPSSSSSGEGYPLPLDRETQLSYHPTRPGSCPPPNFSQERGPNFRSSSSIGRVDNLPQLNIDSNHIRTGSVPLREPFLKYIISSDVNPPTATSSQANSTLYYQNHQGAKSEPPPPGELVPVNQKVSEGLFLNRPNLISTSLGVVVTPPAVRKKVRTITTISHPRESSFTPIKTEYFSDIPSNVKSDYNPLGYSSSTQIPHSQVSPRISNIGVPSYEARGLECSYSLRTSSYQLNPTQSFPLAYPKAIYSTSSNLSKRAPQDPVSFGDGPLTSLSSDLYPSRTCFQETSSSKIRPSQLQLLPPGSDPEYLGFHQGYSANPRNQRYSMPESSGLTSSDVRPLLNSGIEYREYPESGSAALGRSEFFLPESSFKMSQPLFSQETTTDQVSFEAFTNRSSTFKTYPLPTFLKPKGIDSSPFSRSVPFPNSQSASCSSNIPPYHHEGHNATSSTHYSTNFIPRHTHQPDHNHPQASFQALSAHLLKTDLIKQGIEKFNGTPHRFWPWIGKLEEYMTNLSLTPREILAVLISHSEGDPQQVIRNHQDSRGTITMKDVEIVWKELTERFGSDSQISSELTTLIKEFPPIKGKDLTAQLDRLVDLCKIVLYNQEKCEDLKFLNHSLGMECIREKLPDFIQVEWRKIGSRYKKEIDKYPSFEFLVNFLNDQSKKLSNKSFAIVHPSSQPTSSKKEVKILNTKVQTKSEFKPGTSDKRTKYCLFHKEEGHKIHHCPDFKRLKQSEKEKKVLELNLCYRCLGKHLIADCRVNVICELCGGKHATALHKGPSKPKTGAVLNSGNSKEEEPKSSTSETKTTTVLCTKIKENQKNINCSKTLLVEISLDNLSEKIIGYAIIDEQSTNTLVDERVLDFFGVDFPITNYTMKVATQDCELKSSGKLVSGLQVRGILEDEIIPIPVALSVHNIADTTSEVASPQLVRQNELIAKYASHFPKVEPQASVLLLIGRDCGRAMYTECLTNSEPYLHRTPLGYSLVGQFNPSEASSQEHKEVKTLQTSTELEFPVEIKYDFTPKPSGDVDTYATYPDDDHLGSSRDDKEFLSLVKPNIKINMAKNIEIPLPRRDIELPDNEAPVYHRTKKTISRLLKEPEKLEECVKSIQKSLDNGYVEKVPIEEVRNPSNDTWSLPIFCVEQKKKALRLVYDASARYGGISLNDALYQGPDLNNQLRSVLLRFREKPIAFAADIQAMFNNFAVPSHQKDLMRFFWFDNNDPSQELVTYRSTCHIFGCVSSPAVSTLGLKYCAEHLPIEDEAREYLDKNFYVDDGLHSTDSPTSAIEILSKTATLLKSFNMKLHKIVSNSPKVLEHFPDALRSASTTLPSENENCTALGVQWNTESDRFTLIPNIPSRPFTKRGILSTINSLFDPQGIASPVILQGRLMQRQILLNDSDLKKYEWDDQLPHLYFERWSHWISSLDRLSELNIPRGFYPENFLPIRQELHLFSDASEKAIGHVAYLRSINKECQPHVCFVSASSKLAPRAATSMPRLELNAAVEASKSASKIVTELRCKPDAVYFHTDSQIVLGYLSNQRRRFSKYVERRVNMINSVFPNTDWSYIASKENPADQASRPCSPQEILSGNWLQGPDFLWDSEYTPENSNSSFTSPTNLPEEEIEVSTLATKVTEPSRFSNLFSKFSSFRKLINVFKYVLKFARILDKVRQKNGSSDTPRSMEVSDLEAKNELIKQVQTECFSEELKKLKSGNPLSDSNKLSDLAPTVDQTGLLRVGGRLKHSDVDFSVKHPILIPQDHPLSSVIIQHFHRLNKHQGTLITHNSIIQHGFHILNGRSLIRNFLKACITCRKLRGKTCEQIMSDLPPDRLVQDVPPFTHVGIDVFGPFYVHDGKSTRTTSGTKKIWALIIVCLPSRAIHLEYLPGMDTSSFRNAFNRFQAIRGPCLTIRSDQGTNFVLARKQMEAVDISSFSKELQAQGIQWTFNPPHASHQGGSWERKIGSCRRVLEATFKLISNRGISRDEFITFLAEAASIVNNTPLWTPSSDPNDPSPLTPQMLLTLRKADEFHTLDDYTPEDILSYGPKRYRRCQYLASQFWHRWKTEYLHTLTTRQKWRKPSPCISEGDIVLIRDKNLPRNAWSLGRVNTTKPSSDGRIRKVTLTLPPLPGKKSTRTMERAITDLVLLVPSDAHPV